jgi:hypothetical protein
MTCLASFDISHDAGFARMRAVDDFAFRAVLQSYIDMRFHQEPPESPALYSEISAAKRARAFARVNLSVRWMVRRGFLDIYPDWHGSVGEASSFSGTNTVLKM